MGTIDRHTRAEQWSAALRESERLMQMFLRKGGRLPGHVAWPTSRADDGRGSFIQARNRTAAGEQKPPPRNCPGQDRFRPKRQLINLTYRLLGVDPTVEHDWKRYTAAMLVFSLVSALFTYAILRMQQWLPIYQDK